MKKIIYLSMSILGLLGILSLYVIVTLYKEEAYPNIRHIVMIIGYISLILFIIGWLKYIVIKRKVENKETL